VNYFIRLFVLCANLRYVLYPKDLFQVLEFDKLIQMAISYCKGQPGIDLFDTVKLSVDATIIEKQLSQVSEFKLSIESGNAFPIGNYTDHKTFPQIP
jgi:DNA mismatch repair protein MutS2